MVVGSVVVVVVEEEDKERRVGRWIALQVKVVEVEEVEGRLLGRRAVGSLAMLGCLVVVVFAVARG